MRLSSGGRGWRRSVLPAALLVSVALCAAPAVAGAAPSALWQRCDGGEDDISCGFVLRGVATAPASAPAPGHVYVADQSSKAIDEFTAWGEFVRAWGWDVVQAGPGNTGAGFEICVPANGDVCKAGVAGSGAGQFAAVSPQGVAVDSAGNVYVADSGSPSNNRVQKFSPTGEFLRMWGKGVNTGTSGNSEICTNAGPPTDICGPGGQGTGNGQFGAWPAVGSFIATGPGNKVFVGDVGRIQQFDAEGVYQSQITAGLSAGDKIRSLAVSSSGNVYAAIEGKENVRRWNSGGTELTSVTVAEPQALAVDSSSNLYVVSGSSNALIRKFNPGGAQLESWGQEEPPAPKLAAPTGIAAGSACLASGANVYVANNSPGFLRAYGAAPTKLAQCPMPAKAPTVVAQYAVSVGDVEAALRAQINSHFWPDATYYVQYGTAACLEGGWEVACVQRKPAAAVPLGPAGDGPATTADLLLSGLSPDTDYRFRFVAQSGAGGPVFGAERAFHTFAAPGGPGIDTCPNALLRSGPAASLPDCRAYEMVTPLDKGGGDILSFENSIFRSTALEQSSVTGDGITYSSFQAFGDSETQPYTAQYIARRDPVGGWSSEAISPSRGVAVGGVLVQLENEFKAFSPDLCSSWLVGVNKAFAPLLTPDTTEGAYNLYRRSNCGGGGYTALGAGALSSGDDPLELQGLSGDGSHAIFRTQDHLAQDAATSLGRAVKCQTAGGAPTIAFQWLREGAPIPAATKAQYTTQAADAGKTVQCQVRLANANAGATQIANPAWVVAPYPATEPPKAPSTIAAPVASGELAVGGPGGETLTCDPAGAAWGGLPSFAYQWYRNGIALESSEDIIHGSQTAIYTVQSGDLASPAAFQCEVLASNTGGKVAEVSENALTTPAPSGPAAPRVLTSTTATGFDGAVYESLGGGDPRSVCLLPGERTESAECSAGTASPEFTDGRSSNVAGAISEDGSRVFWSAGNQGVGRIFTRIGGGVTIPVSSAAAQFWGAAKDGSKAIYSPGGPAADSIASLDLYEFDSATQESHLIAHKVAGVLGASDDESAIYFVSSEALAGGAPAGQPNLYLYKGGSFAFVGTLSAADARARTKGETEPSPLNVEPVKHSARVSPDGGTTVFMSSARLTAYDNTDAESGVADTEVYRYEAASGKLDCISCNPSGARPAGRNVITREGLKPFWVVARIPGWPTQLYASRALSANGKRVFFDSFEALVPADTNSEEDAYQWEAVGEGACSESAAAYSPAAGGCVTLLSSGKSPQGSEFVDASPSGDDAFIRTGSSLVPRDPGEVDIYDARIEGGFAEPQVKPPCEGEACQNPPPAPDALTPASSSFNGASNQAPSQRKRCPKGKRRVMRGSKARCVAKRQSKRRGNHEGRAQR